MASGGMATGTTAIPEEHQSLALIWQQYHRTLFSACRRKTDMYLVAQMDTTRTEMKPPTTVLQTCCNAPGAPQLLDTPCWRLRMDLGCTIAHQPVPVATPQSCPGNQKLHFKLTLASKPIPSRAAKAVPCGRTAGLEGRWSSIAADSRPQTTSTADMLFGPLLQVRQEKAAEKHNQRHQIQNPLRGSGHNTASHIN